MLTKTTLADVSDDLVPEDVGADDVAYSPRKTSSKLLAAPIDKRLTSDDDDARSWAGDGKEHFYNLKKVLVSGPETPHAVNTVPHTVI